MSQNTGGPPAIDFMALLSRCLGNFKIVDRALSAFRITGQSDLEQLQQAVETADFPAMTEIAHRFQGAASNVSATRLHELLKQVERCAREQGLDELRLILDRLRPEWDEFERYSQSFTTGSNGSVKQSPAFLETSHARAHC